MASVLTNKRLAIINFTIVGFFLVIYLLNKYQIDYTIIGVFRELLTIPFLLAQIVFLILGVRFLLKGKYNALMIVSLLSLAVCTYFTISGFF